MNINKLLLSFSAFCTLLIIIRNQQWGAGFHVALVDQSSLFSGATFLFLIWNLFLAWIPYGLSLVIERIPSRKAAIVYGIPLLFVWLLFLPNAPYIITDFIHLRARPPIPIWFDLIVFFAFAWTGLLLGIFSILKVEKFIGLYFYKNARAYLPILILPLCAMGVYLGRFLRWNSWDIFSHPQSLILELWSLLNSFQFYQDVGIFILPFSILLYFLYWTIQANHNSLTTKKQSL